MSKRTADKITPSPKRKPQCTREGCDADALFGIEGRKAERCGPHKKQGHTIAYCGHCRVCGSTASYGQLGGKRQHCATHKEEGEINLRSARCRMCDTIASYRIDDGPVEWCIRHLPSEPLVPIPKAKATGRKFCDVDGCRTRASFGFEGGLVHRCGKHREPGQINLRARTCEFCRTKARFGFPGDELRNAKWCRKHAPDGTTFLEHRKLCETEECSKIAWYGPTKSGIVHCREHRTVDDVVARYITCTHCDKRPMWGAPSNNRTRTKVRCHTHRLPGDVSYQTRRDR